MPIALQSFLDRHRPDKALKKVSAEHVNTYRGHLPEALLELWHTHGFGFYGDGLIQLIDPDRYRDNLWGWLMREEPDMERLPIALGAFGEVFYYRKLSDDGDEDVSYLNPHTSEGDCLIWSLPDFFNQWCCDNENIATLLQPDRVRQAAQTQGPLADNEIYYFVPALRLGGSGGMNTVARGDAAVQLDLLLQLALDN